MDEEAKPQAHTRQPAALPSVDLNAALFELMARRGVRPELRGQSRLDWLLSKPPIVVMLEDILEGERSLEKQWALQNRLFDIERQSWTFANGTAGKAYAESLDREALALGDVVFTKAEGLAELGLAFDPETGAIAGTPQDSGQFEITFHFHLANAEAIADADVEVVPEPDADAKAADQTESESKTEPEPEPEIEATPEAGQHDVYTKTVSLVINPDPRTLWKCLPSDRSDIFWKEDDDQASGELAGRRVAVASKRGRSHQHVGSFRDDDFAMGEAHGWGIVAVSDGAGSAQFSRKGSEVVCHAVVDFFTQGQGGTAGDGDAEPVALLALDQAIAECGELLSEDELAAITTKAKSSVLYPATLRAHAALTELAKATFAEHPDRFKDPKPNGQLAAFHATLIFCLFKQFSCGYVFLTFGVGDCPIAVINTAGDSVNLLNQLDVGEFGGGTRFISQRDIFTDENAALPMAKRFNVVVKPDFGTLFLMTDGIYDPKFSVEANLEKIECWQEFLADLRGENEDGRAVDFSLADASQTAAQLSDWMDFFSKGNHDDRTLAVVY